MEEIIELTLDSADGTIDCRLELADAGNTHHYSATILYPATVNGYSRSEIYCYNLLQTETGSYIFDSLDDIHPKIKKLEQQLSKAIKK